VNNRNPRRDAITAGAAGNLEHGKLTSPSPTVQHSASADSKAPDASIAGSMLNCALAYASHGLHVFPLHSVQEGRCTCGKDCGRNGGKHPQVSGGFKVATKNPRQIQAWWCKWPNANIGIATGGISGIIVVDIDGSEALTRLRELESSYGSLPKTLTAKTARGWHLYFKHPHSELVIPCTARDGIDIRGDGGYVVAPPSVHRNGHIYQWCNDVVA
jgi:putative DNA primase/helicase